MTVTDTGYRSNGDARRQTDNTSVVGQQYGNGDGTDGEPHPVDILGELRRRMGVQNLAEELSPDILSKLGRRVCDEAEIDDDSREEWKKRTEAGMKLALQKGNAKTFPWPGAANVRFPLMTTAAIQFAARAYPAIVSGSNVVKAQVTGEDPQGLKRKKGDRIAAHMSWQCLTEMKEWESEVDKMLHSLPILGCAFKKTFYDPSMGRNRSDYVSAMDLIVNMSAASCEVAPRLTHCFSLYPYQIEERVRSKLFLDQDYSQNSTGTQDEDAPIEFYEQHRRYDLDDDGYDEPYICTVHKDTQKVARVRSNYDEMGIRVNQATGDVIGVDPIQYFTKIPFIPNPDGGFYDVGFGWLLSPLNEAINTVLNQLLDAGTLANTGGGFIGSQLRLKGGTMRFQPGEYKEIDVPGGVAKDNIVPLTFPGPSPVLFQLLGMLIESGREVASVKDVLTGQEPAANTPATTTLAMIEQGLKVFTSIYKRIHRGLKDEFAKLYKLNQTYFDPEAYAAFQDAPNVEPDDYHGDPMDIIPVSDPQMVSDMQKLARAEFLKQFMGVPFMEPQAIMRRLFQAAGIENIDELFAKPKGPPPELLAKVAELTAEIENKHADTDQKKAATLKLMAEAEGLGLEQRIGVYRLLLDTLTAHNEAAANTMIPGAEGAPPQMGAIKPVPIAPALTGGAPMPNGGGVPA